MFLHAGGINFLGTVCPGRRLEDGQGRPSEERTEILQDLKAKLQELRAELQKLRAELQERNNKDDEKGRASAATRRTK